jgi:uncharacterized membrane protein
MKQVNDQALEESLQLGPERLHAEDAVSPSDRTTRREIPRLTNPSPWQASVPGMIVLLGFLLRVLYINHESLDGDEAFSMTVSQLPLREMMRQLVDDFVHPPLHYFMLRGWFKLLGFGVLQARMLSVVFGTLAIVFLYLLVRYLFDRRIALLSSLLLAVSQLAIMLSQEARPYAQFHFLVLLSAYLFVRAWREGRAIFWWGCVGSTILMIYTDYFSVFVIATLFLLVAIYRRRYKLRRRWVTGGIAIILALYLPWMTSGILQAAAHAPKTVSGTTAYARMHWWTFFSIVNAFNNGKTAGLRTDSPWWTFVVGGLLFVAPMVILIKKLVVAEGRGIAERLDREGVAIVSFLWLLPVLLTLGLGSTLNTPYNVRYVSFCVALYYIFVARGIFELRLNALRWGLVVFILLYSANSLRANYFMRWKEYWDEAFTYVEHNRQEGDCGFFLPGIQIPQPWTITQAARPTFRAIPHDNLSAGVTECGRVWEVAWAPHNDPWLWANHEAESAFLETTHRKIAEQRFFGVHVSLYSRKER